LIDDGERRRTARAIAGWIVPAVLTATVLCVAALGSTPARAFLCPGAKETPKVRLKYDLGEVAYDRGLGTRGLKRLIQKLELNMNLTRGQVLGLTTGRFQARYRTSITGAKARTGGYCVWLKTAEITVGFQDLTVYINRAYEDGTCESDAVEAHEQEHVAINRAVLKKYLPRLEQVVSQAVAYKPFIRVLGGPEQAREAYIQHFGERLGPLLREMEAERVRRNNRIDTPESYAEVAGRCEDW
jgi:hypothetical protein